jgi:hypothetical protein
MQLTMIVTTHKETSTNFKRSQTTCIDPRRPHFQESQNTLIVENTQASHCGEGHPSGTTSEYLNATTDNVSPIYQSLYTK